MQLNDVIKSIGWYRVFAVLLIRTNIAKSSTDTDTSIGIGASLALTTIPNINSYLGKIVTILKTQQILAV